MDATLWAAWLQGIGTLAAIGASVYFWDRERRHRGQTDERQQASHVAAWVAEEPPADGHSQGGLPGDGGPGQRRRYRIMYTNASPLPVYRVVIDAVLPVSQRYYRTFPVLPPTSSPTVLDVVDWAEGPSTALEPELELTFRDAAGQEWCRSASGLLRRLGPATAARPLGDQDRVWRS